MVAVHKFKMTYTVTPDQARSYEKCAAVAHNVKERHTANTCQLLGGTQFPVLTESHALHCPPLHMGHCTNSQENETAANTDLRKAEVCESCFFERLCQESFDIGSCRKNQHDVSFY